MTAGEPFEVHAIESGVTAPLGFRASGLACGIKKDKLDLALIAADRPAAAAGLFTTNLAQAAPIVVSREHLRRSSGTASAIVANSGCANACTGHEGLANARATVERVAETLQCPSEQVLVASTGVIGVALAVDKIKRAVPELAAGLSRNRHTDAAKAIMTTDPFPKEAGVAVTCPSGTFRVGGMAKGSGMIEPCLATMLAFLTTDARVAPALLQNALSDAVEDTFNAITVDGECSTNDTVFAMASGASGMTIGDRLYGALSAGLRAVCRELALGIVRGGEGATKVICVVITGADSPHAARRAARTVANSLLVKTAIHGSDPNWGRLVSAAGRAGVRFHLEDATVAIGPTVLFKGGQPHDEASSEAAAYLNRPEVEIRIDLGTGGQHHATMWTCDLSAEYVRINAEYRT